MNNSMLGWILLIPSIAGLIAFLWPRRMTWIVQMLTVGVCAWMGITLSRLFTHIGDFWVMNWVELDTFTLSLNLLVTQFGIFIALFISIFGLLLSIYCIGFTKKNIGRHYAYLLWTIAGGIGAALANNLIFLLICWEITTLMLFLLVNEGGESAKAGAAKTFAVLGFSDGALLLGIGLLMFVITKPTLTMDRISVTIDSPLTILCFLLFLIAALAKAGAMPLHTWIPAISKGAPTDVMAFLPASLDKLLGIYLLARCSVDFFKLTPKLQLLLMTIGAVSILGAVMMALVQHDLKKLLSFHAVSQVGYMVLGIGTGSLLGIAGGLFHMINNAIYKCCLFLTAGSVEKQSGSTNLDDLGGLARTMPFSFVACVIAALAISGVPPMNGFASKWLIYQACLDVPSRWAPILVAAAVFGSALTLASFIKVIHGVFLGSTSSKMGKKTITESPAWMTAPMLVLAILCILFGIFATVPLSRFIAPAMQNLGVKGLQEQLSAGEITALTTLWNPVVATVLLLLALGIGVIIFAWGRGFNIRRTNTYIGGEQLPPQTGHYSGTGFYNSIRSLPGVRAIFNDAEKESFDMYRISGRLGNSLVEVLRRSQTGVLSLYLSWVVLGLVIIVVYLVMRSLV